MLQEKDRLNSKNKLRDWLEYEKRFYGRGRVLRTLFPITELDILRKHQIILRKTELYANTGSRILYTWYRFRLMKIQNKYALHIPINTCARGLKLMHVGSILMNENVTVGENCVFHINTALVAGGSDNGVPELGNSVVLGIGSVVVGKVYLANNVAVGANAVVKKDVMQKNVAIAGVPAKIVSNNGRTHWN